MFSFFKKKDTKPSIPKSPYTVPEGSRNKSLEEIDTSYWLTKDQGWMAKRKAQWETIAPMLKIWKPSKGITIIKAYYLGGKMPNWQALETWQDQGEHLDLLMFLWLHPSWDEVLLRELHEVYVHSELIRKGDISVGINALLIITPHFQSSYEIGKEIRAPLLEGHSEMMFRVMLGNPVQEVFQLYNPLEHRGPISERQLQISTPTMSELGTMWEWLICKELNPINRDYLYQYDQPLEWWYECATRGKNYFDVSNNRDSLPSYRKYLYVIHHFDTEKEGDTCRSRFVFKLRQLFDERSFGEELDQIWQDVKAGKIDVENPWVRYSSRSDR